MLPYLILYMERAGLWGFNKKPLALKALISLLFIYTTINLIANFIYVFYTDPSGGGVFDISISFGPIFDTLFTIIGLVIISFPAILTFIAGLLIWKGKHLGYWVSIILLILSFMGLYGAIEYLWENLPILFSEDLLFLRINPSGMTFIFNYGDFNTASTESLLVSRFLTIKSFLKAFIEIVSFGLLFFTVVGYDAQFNRRRWKFRGQ